MTTTESDLGAPTKPFADSYGGDDTKSSPTGQHPPPREHLLQPSERSVAQLQPHQPRAHSRRRQLPRSSERINADADELGLTREVIAQLNREDSSAMIDLQRNAGIRFAEPGILNEREETLVHFHRYLSEQLVVTDPSASTGSIES